MKQLLCLLLIFSVPASAKKSKTKDKPKLELCSKPDLFLTAIVPAPYANKIEDDCLYVVTPSQIQIFQAIKKGVLITAAPEMGSAPFRIAFIEGAKGYADGDMPSRMVVKSAGTFDYVTVSGAASIIRKFKYIEEYDEAKHGRP